MMQGQTNIKLTCLILSIAIRWMGMCKIMATILFMSPKRSEYTSVQKVIWYVHSLVRLCSFVIQFQGVFTWNGCYFSQFGLAQFKNNILNEAQNSGFKACSKTRGGVTYCKYCTRGSTPNVVTWLHGLTLAAGGRKHPSLGGRWIAWSMLPEYRHTWCGVFWNVTPFCLIIAYRRFGGTRYLQLPWQKALLRNAGS